MLAMIVSPPLLSALVRLARILRPRLRFSVAIG